MMKFVLLAICLVSSFNAFATEMKDFVNKYELFESTSNASVLYPEEVIGVGRTPCTKHVDISSSSWADTIYINRYNEYSQQFQSYIQLGERERIDLIESKHVAEIKGETLSDSIYRVRFLFPDSLIAEVKLTLHTDEDGMTFLTFIELNGEGNTTYNCTYKRK